LNDSAHAKGTSKEQAAVYSPEAPERENKKEEGKGKGKRRRASDANEMTRPPSRSDEREDGINAKKDRVEELIENEHWSDARRVIEEELKKAPDDHWLLTRLSTTYYEVGDYKTALKWVEKARKFAPECPLVLWDYAGTLDMLGRERDALSVHCDLLRRSSTNLAENECGEGLEWALDLQTDCWFRAARCLEDIGGPRCLSLAIRVYRFYLGLVDLGATTIYPRQEVLKRLLKLLKAGKRRTIIEETLHQAGGQILSELARV
jgi:tetratricopeptide (TPR) repeat protein